MLSCHSQYRSTANDLVDFPEHWQAIDTSGPLMWSRHIASTELENRVREGIAHNPDVQIQALQVELAQTELFRGRMRYVPSLDLRLNGGRRATQTAFGNTVSNQFSLTADLQYELNLWGQISTANRAAALNLARARAEFDAVQRNMALLVSLAWADVIEAQQLSQLGSERLSNLENNLGIIESGYRSGLNSALEVYLARNDVERERARQVQNGDQLNDSLRALSTQMGRFPSTDIQAAADFPETLAPLPAELPSEQILRRPDLRAAWLAILAQDAQLAVAHKARFPSLRLTASGGRSSAELAKLLEDNNPLWSVSASLVQPLLAAGQLKAAEERARLQLEQFEYRYTRIVHDAFAQIESLLEKQTSLQQRHALTLQARDNALLAEKLSFEQYLKGLVTYTTVLDAQRRAVDAEIQLIALNKQRFTNQIRLFDALAGKLDFIASDTQP